jgi:hypothetical protein
MENGQEQSARTRVRSPGFPFIGLKKALARVQEFYDGEKRNWANLKVAVKHWGFNEASSGGKQTAAALIAYGLLDDNGSGDARQVRLSETALKIILDKRNPSPDRQRLVKDAAIRPKLHNEIWQKYAGQLPSAENLRHFLLFEHEPPFNENWVDHFIGEFTATLEFAGLLESDIIVGSQGGKSSLEDEVIDELAGESAMPQTQATELKKSTDAPATIVGRTPVGSDIPVAADCIMGVNAIGRVTQMGIDKLISYLQLIKGSFPQNGEA